MQCKVVKKRNDAVVKKRKKKILIRIIRYVIGPTIIPSHGKTCPRVVEIVKSEHVTAFAADIKQK